MKFGHDFKESLRAQDFPAHWVDHAIPYSQLKKCLKKVAQELHELGLDPETLRDLLNPDETSPVALKYKLNGGADSHLRPKLTVQVHIQDGVPVDASLAPNSRDFLNKIAINLQQNERSSPIEPVTKSPNLDSEKVARKVDTIVETAAAPSPRAIDALTDEANIKLAITLGNENTAKVAEKSATDSEQTEPPYEDLANVSANASLTSPPADGTEGTYEIIEVPLVFDAEFFDMLQSDVNNLDALQTEEEKTMNSEIVALGKEVEQVVKPKRFSRTDLARWRQIFELYLDAEVFFATHEQDHGERTSQVALRQLQWFQDQVAKQNLVKDFKLPESKAAFTRFINLNASLLKNMQFQELNKTAITKILKKFDKRTALGVARKFPTVVHSDKLLAGTIARDVCAQMSQELVSKVPQLNDYLCPVCFSVAYMPVRLDCQHVFCIRCVIKIQRRMEKHCPLCRADVVLKASAMNLDYELQKYMKKYFAKEVKEKERANEIERGIEDYGPGYVHQECCIM
ncbi:putative RING finger protein C6B12.07c [Fusarium austroafricanum]|uniref:Putative RING finger protein C6B12.07c n=1 Tax=Fusarium austroafricanum TaxID=2364996 RepID=A0A8H4KLL9_9HYPO|nr:putative RING finger protein C6B12.07c [Fusarium austroafricanum]